MLKILPRYSIYVIGTILLHGWILQPMAKAQVKGDVELLKTVAEKYRANLEKLKTWRGEVKWPLHSIEIICECSIDFACDFTLPAKRWAITLGEQHISDKGIEKTMPPECRFGMYRDGAYYQLIYKDKNKRHEANVQDRPFMQPALNYGTFDAQFYLTFEGIEPDEIGTKLYKGSKEKETTGVTIIKDGNILTIQTVLEKYGPAPVALYQFDLSKGANFTKVEMRSNETNRKSEGIWRWIWEEVNGVWVPKEFSKDVVAILPNPRATHYRVLWTKNEVNIPLEKDEFSLVKLGLRQGDQVYDSRTHKKYTITDKSFPPPVNIKPTEQIK